ncbi:MAG: DNA-processing protein DprA [Candidatus Omnitrophica bacterium]|jgi:DNA processing protein|nr:DNA-processing protein DprA [Candidatus Omnitrophota bacterium]
MTKLEALISLNMVGEIGSIRLGRLLDYFGKFENVFRASAEKLITIAGISENVANRIHTFKPEDLTRELESAQKLGLKIIILGDADYPEILKNIPSPPIVLYVKGKLEKEDNLAIGIVGSRRASYYGLSSAEKFAAELAGCGLTIVSGMARGIDTAAHRGALKMKGRTLAVIGSGFKHIYPEENIALAEEITANGAVISEFSINTQPFKENFPRRNRLISGLSLGTLVVEAARNSGALITADFALEQGKEVFCLPGRIDSPGSFGTNELIKQGAKLVSTKDDILEELQVPLRIGIKETKIKNRLQNHSAGSESALYDLIPTKPVFLDELLEKTGLQIPQAYEILLRLKMQKLIKQLPGKQFMRSN